MDRADGRIDEAALGRQSTDGLPAVAELAVVPQLLGCDPVLSLVRPHRLHDSLRARIAKGSTPCEAVSGTGLGTGTGWRFATAGATPFALARAVVRAVAVAIPPADPAAAILARSPTMTALVGWYCS